MMPAKKLLLTGILFSLSFYGYAQNFESIQWTPEDMARLVRVGSPTVSPDGRLVAYELRETKMDGEDSSYLTHIWVAAADGSMNRQFTQGDKSAVNPQFTRDGKAITFLSSRNDNKRQVFRLYLNGGEAEQITHAVNGVNSYKWSPDGTRIAYTMSDPETDEEKKNKKEKRDVVLVDKNFHYSRLYVETIREKRAQNTTKKLTAMDAQVLAFDWSPDGKSLVFSHQPTPNLDDALKSDIALVPADSGAVTRLVTWEGADGNPRFSFDGSYVVFESQGGKEEPIGLTDVYRVPARGGNPVALARTPDRNASIVDWNPDGNHILVQESNRTFTALYNLPVDGKPMSRITPDDGVYRGFSLSEDGQYLVFTYEQPELEPNVYISSLRSFNKRRLTDIYKDVKFPEMGKTELLSWASKDGMRIEGLLTYPVNYKPGTKVPLILNVHGGPSGVFSQTWTGASAVYPIQYFAAEGFAVLRPNPRGSTGYGKDFRYANVQDWGFGDYEDLMAGVDLVIEKGIADPDNLFEMGWSYGGYMTSFIVTRTNRFNAVSMGAGLPNLISMVNTTDIHYYLAGHMGGYYWDSPEIKAVYERHSAIYQMDKISTPTQIIHGQADVRVPTSQGEEFYWALKTRQVPTELILYPRTPHGPQEPKFVVDIPLRIMTWFNRYRK